MLGRPTRQAAKSVVGAADRKHSPSNEEQVAVRPTLLAQQVGIPATSAMPQVALMHKPSWRSSADRRPDDPGAVLRRERNDAVLVEPDPGSLALLYVDEELL